MKIITSQITLSICFLIKRILSFLIWWSSKHTVINNNKPNNFCGAVSLLGQSQICATFFKMCAQMNFYFLFKIRDTTFCKKITKTGVSLVKKAQNYTQLRLLPLVKDYKRVPL